MQPTKLCKSVYIAQVRVLTSLGDISLCAHLMWQWVLPEVVGTLALSVILVLSYHWIVFLVTLPVAVFNLHR